MAPVPAIAWVTGASSGIGAALSLKLAQAGWRVAASARSAEALEAMAQSHRNISPFALDVTDAAAVQKTVRAIGLSLGEIDLAVLNAGQCRLMAASEFDSEAAQQIWAVNYGGVIHGLGAVMPQMIGRRSGHIAIMSSIAGYAGLPRAAAYNPAKAALISLAECLKADLDRHGVKLQIISPGFVDTPMTRVNDFKMPFLIPADDAAARIINGLSSSKFEISFPWPLVIQMKLLRLLPYPLFFRLTKAMLGRPQAKS